MKKLYLLFILVISCVCINVNAKTIYLTECEYTQQYINWLKLSEEEKSKVMAPTMCKNKGNDRFALVGNGMPQLNNVSVNDSRFDLRDYNLVTSVKNQGVSSSCWAFSTNASIESNLLVNDLGTYDLSEAHIELSTQGSYQYNRLTFARKIDNGGNSYYSAAYLRNNWGPVLETELPFEQYLTYVENEFDNKYAISEDKILTDKHYLDVDSITMFGDYDHNACSNVTMQDIKEYLITNGALSASMFITLENSYQTNIYYDGKGYTNLNNQYVLAQSPANHAVTIVGWDDTISKNSFSGNSKPTRDGAFIIKNSYGHKQEMILLDDLKQIIYDSFKTELNLSSPADVTDQQALTYVQTVFSVTKDKLSIEDGSIYVTIGEDGYQYVSYDDIRICDTLSGFFNVSNEVEDYVYGYDDLGVYKTLQSSEVNEGYFVSIFEKKSDQNEKLVEINTYFNAVGQEYEIYFANAETRDINAATLVAKGTSKFVGYDTIKIEDSIISNDKYSVIIKLTDKNGLSFGISSGGSVSEKIGDMQYHSGVQFLSFDGKNFADVTQETSLGHQFHLIMKAYTNEVTQDDGETGDTNDPNSGENNKEENNNNPEGGNNNNEGNNNNPEDGNDNPEGGQGNEQPGNNGEDEPPVDDTTDDSKIEVLPNDKNDENNNTDDDNISNPDTGDNTKYVVFAISIMVFVVIISYRKTRELFIK